MSDNSFLNGISGTVIEDVFSSTPQHIYDSQNTQFQSSNDVPQDIYHMQFPQPLKQSNPVYTDYTASTNTINQFNYHNQFQQSHNQFQNLGFQKNAIRGKVANQHVYHWNAPQQPQQQPTLPQPIVPSKPFITDSKQLLREAITDTYKNCWLIFTHKYGDYCIFKAPVEGLTGGVFKYIVAIIKASDNLNNIQLGGYDQLENLKWINFQTRHTDNPALEFGEVRPPATSYYPPSDNKSPLYDKINMVLNDVSKFVYMAENLPIKVELIKLKDTDVAADKASLMSALDAFKTVITFLDI
jgi:hypothetical protein